MTKPAYAMALLSLIASLSAATAQAKPSETCSAYIAEPLPAEASSVVVPAQPPACASYRSYQGIGRKKDLTAARACAWMERSAHLAKLGQNQAEPAAWVVGGPLILADIYFNGDGVPRNRPLAMRFACEFEESTAKLSLEALAQTPSLSSKRFELCDYAATTFTMNFCAAYRQEIKDDAKLRFYKALRKRMTPEQKSAFDRLLVAQAAYVNQHANEVDQGGSIRTLRTMGSQNILNEAFHTDLVHFERKRWSLLSPRQIVTAEGAQERQYQATLQALRTREANDLYEGAVRAEDVAAVQHTWQNYKDAWMSFAAVRYPTAQESIVAEISLERARLLKTIR